MRLIRRMVHQAYRNGAKEVFVTVPEECEVSEEEQYGFYRLKRWEGGLWQAVYAPQEKEKGHGERDA